ncbi:MAG: signal peptidase I [Pseudomonadota bacterium]
MSEQTAPSKKKSSFGETVSVIIQALILALVLRSFLFQPFNIPSGSMKPTLLIGDYLFVSKFSYGYSRYSLPFGPDIFSGRIWSAEPKRGDVAVFKYPPNPSRDYIKRVVGLPGDKIQMKDGVLFINGEAVKREAAGTFIDKTESGRSLEVAQYRETLPNGVSYMTLDINPNSVSDNTRVFEVPADHYFMMGDNRDNSSDSRFDVGMVPFENFVGRASVIFISVADGAAAWQFWRWPQSLRTERLFNGISG